MRCLHCQYDLKNLAEHRCPECGCAFDPDDPNTLYHSPFEGLNVERASSARLALVASIFSAIFLGFLIVGHLSLVTAALAAFCLIVCVVPLIAISGNGDPP